MKSKYVTVTVIVLLIFFVSGCIPGSGHYSGISPAGFFTGIWHGWIAPVSLILGLFNPDIRVYETYNTGWWYDFGFYIAIVGGFGGIAFSRSKSANRKNT